MRLSSLLEVLFLNSSMNKVFFVFLCRMTGMLRSMSKLPTYRRRFRQIVKALVIYSIEKEGVNRSVSGRSVSSVELV